MTAIITNWFKKQIVQDIVDDVADSAARYFIGIGRSEDWDSADAVPTPVNTWRDERNARLSLQSVKSAEDVSFVIPRNNWSPGTIYSAYDDNVVGYPAQKYYVITEDNQVYICLQQGRNVLGIAVTSTVKPTGTSLNVLTTADGYSWKFLYSLPAASATKYLSANYIPIRFVATTDSSSPAVDVEQETVQNGAITGQISGVRVTTTGTGYSSTPTVTIVGDGTLAAAVATVDGGAVVKVEMSNDSAAYGVDYTRATVAFSGGSPTTPAEGQAILSPVEGFGDDPRNDLRANAVMFNTKPAGAEGGDFIIGNDFRQVMIIRNLKIPVTDSDFTAGTGLALRSLKFDTVSAAFTADKTLLGSTSAAGALVDRYDAATKTVHFHQNETTGFVPFVEAETVTETDGSGSGILDSAGVDADSDAFGASEVNIMSGDVLFIDNRAAITRSTEQTEDIKVIIQL